MKILRKFIKIKFIPKKQAAVQEFETRLDECLQVNENPDADKNNESDIGRRTNVPIVKRQNRGGKGAKGKQPPAQKGGRATRGNRRNVPTDSDSEDSDVEKENPRRGKGKQRIIESDSDDDEPLPRKMSQKTRNSSVRLSRASNRTKVIEELSTSGENILRENNSFEA